MGKKRSKKEESSEAESSEEESAVEVEKEEEESEEAEESEEEESEEEEVAKPSPKKKAKVAAPDAEPTTTGRKLFVGGLSWDTDEDGLKEFFKECGEVEE